MKALNLKRRLLSCVAIMMMLLLTGCFGATRSERAYGHRLQGHYLYLKAGQPYIPERDEKWVGPALLQEKDQTIIEQSEVLHKYGIAPYLPKPAKY